MERKVIISCDSCADLSQELVEKYNIAVNPMPIMLGDKQYADGVDIQVEDLFKYARETKQLAKTSAQNTAFFENYFNNLTADGSEVVHFTISSSMSGSYNFARIAAAGIDGVYVIDSANLSTGIALLALKACELAEEGKSGAEIEEEINALKPYVDSSFVIDTLEFLHKGGRCSAVAMLGANVLKLKPCIEVTDGKMDVGKKYRGKIEDVIRTYVKERLASTDDIDLHRIFITHTCGEDAPVVKDVADIVKAAAPFEEVLTTNAGCIVSAHCGPGTLGVLFIRKTPKSKS